MSLLRLCAAILVSMVLLTPDAGAISGPLGERTCLKGRVRGSSVKFTKRVVSTEVSCPRGFTEIVDGSDYKQDGPYDAIPSGRTVYGVVEVDYYATDTNVANMYVSLPVPAENPLVSANVVVVETAELVGDCGVQSCINVNDISEASHCPGSATSPEADPGYLCIYPIWAANIETNSLEGQGFAGTDGSPFGFLVRLYPFQLSMRTYLEAVWAFTAP